MKLKHLPHFMKEKNTLSFLLPFSAYCEWKHFYYVVIPPSITAATFIHRKKYHFSLNELLCYWALFFPFCIHLCNRCALLSTNTNENLSEVHVWKIIFSIILPRSRIDNNNKSNNIKKYSIEQRITLQKNGNSLYVLLHIHYILFSFGVSRNSKTAHIHT